MMEENGKWREKAWTEKPYDSGLFIDLNGRGHVCHSVLILIQSWCNPHCDVYEWTIVPALFSEPFKLWRRRMHCVCVPSFPRGKIQRTFPLLIGELFKATIQGKAVGSWPIILETFSILSLQCVLVLNMSMCVWNQWADAETTWSWPSGGEADSVVNRERHVRKAKPPCEARQALWQPWPGLVFMFWQTAKYMVVSLLLCERSFFFCVKSGTSTVAVDSSIV